MSSLFARLGEQWRALVSGRGTLAPDITPSADLLRRLGVADAEGWAAALVPACAEREIATRPRLAHFLANVLHETGDFRRLRESLNYTPEALRRTWPGRFSDADAERWGRKPGQPADERAIAERAYGGRMGNGPEGVGDGFLFRGRGLIQLTGRANYEAAARAFGLAVRNLPSWLETREGAARAAAWWWQAHGCNALADSDDLVALRRRVNGGLIGLEDVRARLRRVLDAIGP